jgi:hypothetical protein
MGVLSPSSVPAASIVAFRLIVYTLKVDKARLGLLDQAWVQWCSASLEAESSCPHQYMSRHNRPSPL